MLMINDLFINYKHRTTGHFTENDRVNYIDSRYQMFIYVSRINKQNLLAFKLIIKACNNRFTLKDILYYVITFIKLIFAALFKISFR